MMNIYRQRSFNPVIAAVAALATVATLAVAVLLPMQVSPTPHEAEAAVVRPLTTRDVAIVPLRIEVIGRRDKAA